MMGPWPLVWVICGGLRTRERNGELWGVVGRVWRSRVETIERVALYKLGWVGFGWVGCGLQRGIGSSLITWGGNFRTGTGG